MNATQNRGATGQNEQRFPKVIEDFGETRIPAIRNRRATWQLLVVCGILGAMIGGFGAWWFLENFYERIHPILVKMVM